MFAWEQFGLSHLLQAAEQVRPPVSGRASPNKRPFAMGPLPSLASKVSGLHGDLAGPKRARIDSDVSMDMQPSYQVLQDVPRQTMVYPSVHHAQAPANHQHYHQHNFQHQTGPALRRVDSLRIPREEVLSPTSTGAASPAGSFSLGARRGVEPQMVWETVLTTGKFPEDICLSEHNHGSSPPSAGNDETARWSGDEKQYAEAIIQSVRSGEAVLPPNMSIHQFITSSLQSKSLMRRSSMDETSSLGQRSPQFNALSLKSIMNTEGNEQEAFEASPAELVRQESAGKKNTRVLKRSDYSQHGVVRSGRWSVEEENYARAMIEAFKAGYLPLHGNVSLRKFLSEVLVCHPMRISKKFVGYVRKYHWYRIAAGKCDPEARRQALQNLCHLERIFWTSLQQSNEWAHGGYQQV